MKTIFYLLVLSALLTSCMHTVDLRKVDKKNLDYDELPKEIQQVLIDSLKQIHNDYFNYLANLDQYNASVKINNDSYIHEVMYDDKLLIDNIEFTPLPPNYSPFFLYDTVLYTMSINVSHPDSQQIKKAKYLAFNLKKYVRR